MPIDSFGLINIEGLKTQSSSSVSYIEDALREHNMLFIILTETWLRDHLDAEVKVHNYTLFRTDRSRPKKRRGRNSGGVAVYLRDNLAASSEVLFQHSDGGVIEILCVIVRRLNLVICAVYSPPDDPVGREFPPSENCLGHSESWLRFSPRYRR